MRERTCCAPTTAIVVIETTLDSIADMVAVARIRHGGNFESFSVVMWEPKINGFYRFVEGVWAEVVWAELGATGDEMGDFG